LNFDERKKIARMIEDNQEELDLYMEKIDWRQWNCRYGMLCYEVECKNQHNGYAQSARKIIRKAFDKSKKLDKKLQQIHLGEYKKIIWADEC